MKGLNSILAMAANRKKIAEDRTKHLSNKDKKIFLAMAKHNNTEQDWRVE